MSDTSRLRHHASLHAFFMAAKERGYTNFQLQLITNPEGRMEFRITPQRRSKMNAKFEVRGNTVRAAVKDAGVAPTTHDNDIDYGGTRSGEHPVQV
jgi:hypothetical protein